MVDVMSDACGAVEGATGVPCLRVVPAEKPDAFVVLEVERVDATAHAEHIHVAGVAWAKTFAHALELAETAATALAAGGATEAAMAATIDASEPPFVRALFHVKQHRLIF